MILMALFRLPEDAPGLCDAVGTTDEGPRLDSADDQTHASAGKSSCVSVLSTVARAQSAAAGSRLCGGTGGWSAFGSADPQPRFGAGNLNAGRSGLPRDVALRAVGRAAPAGPRGVRATKLPGWLLQRAAPAWATRPLGWMLQRAAPPSLGYRTLQHFGYRTSLLSSGAVVVCVLRSDGFVALAAVLLGLSFAVSAPDLRVGGVAPRVAGLLGWRMVLSAGFV